MRRRNNSRRNFFYRHIYLCSMIICCVAVLALAGVYVYKSNNRNDDREEFIAKINENDGEDVNDVKDIKKDNEKQDNQNDVLDESVSGSDVEQSEQALKTDTLDAEQSASLLEEDTEQEKIEENSVTASAAPESVPVPEPAPEGFNENMTLEWPVSGNIILGYSMDETVYFSTLDQYKYNPAIVIQASVGTNVISAASGTVTSIEDTSETGKTVTVDIGGGYTLVYGQLDNVKLSVSDKISAGDTIGTIKDPTKYYTKEGANLYFKMLKDNAPVNPMDYLG